LASGEPVGFEEIAVELDGNVEERALVVSGEDADRGIEVDDREGPSFDATRALLSMYFLYSYFAARGLD
jgi:hypothetical protein